MAAIVFISPKVKQRKFFTTTLVLVLAVLVTVLVGFFVAGFTGFLGMNQNIPPNPSFNQSNITIDFNVIDSQRVLNLEPFYNLQTEFTYVITDKNGKEVKGNISADTKEDAQKLLQDSGLTVVSLEETSIGRSEPFVAY